MMVLSGTRRTWSVRRQCPMMSDTVVQPRFYLNTYRPLIATRHGREASREHSILPFVDGSIRREPDLEQPFPTISCLCRAGLFAPRLRIGDVVAYVTVKNAERGQRRLPALLKVVRLFDTHVDAAAWFHDQGLPLPSNCLVPGNRPLHMSMSLHAAFGPHRECGKAGCNAWDTGYQMRARQHGRFVVCEALHRDLDWSAPIVHEHHLTEAFGRIPPTRNPSDLPWKGLSRLLSLLGIPAPPCVP